MEDGEITEKEMNDIIQFISALDYEKYQKDMEMREALHVLKYKMEKEQKEKEERFKELQRKSEVIGVVNNEKKNEDENEKENVNESEYNNIKEETITPIMTYEVPKEHDKEKEKKELTQEEKQILEKNWNNSTKIDVSDVIVNSVGDKEKVFKQTKQTTISPKETSSSVYNSFESLSRLLEYNDMKLQPKHPRYPKVCIVNELNTQIEKERSAQYPFIFGEPKL